MEKDKLDLIKKIITLVDTKEGLKKVENAVDEVLRTQWDKEEKDRKARLRRLYGLPDDKLKT